MGPGLSSAVSARRALVAAATCALAACAAPHPAGTDQRRGADQVHLFDAATAIQDEWAHIRLHGETRYRIVAADGEVAIRAVGDRSASGLWRWVDLDPRRCPTVEWSWRVHLLQESADLERKESEDVAASIFLVFGDPGLLSSPDPVPTLRYVWTGARHAPGAVIDNPYLPGTVRSVVVRSGTAALGRWTTERRNILRDYEAAFGRAPTEPVHAIALFTDNDQTEEPVEAWYGSARALCG